jgi:succinyl-CoA synthetase beta subunit
MRLFEYQAKGIFQDYGIPIPKYQVTSNAALAEQIRDEIGNEVVLKAQVLIRGRAKVGGIRLIRPKEDIVNAATEILSLSIKGNKVRKILIEEAIQVQREFFLKIEIDPYLERPVLIASKFDVKKSLANGMEATESRIRIPIEFSLGLLDHHKRKIAVTLELSKDLWEKFSLILTGMWKIFKEMDAVSIEINPLIIDEKNQFLALGAAIDIDDRALFRHSEIQDKREPLDESLLKIEAEKFGISTSQFEGVIGCIVNGDSLGYAIEDMVFSKGSHLGILMDVGRGAGDEKISAGLDILFKNRKTKCILITIFGGLTQCDRVANGIIKSIANTSRNKPLVIYFNGTNSEAGKFLLRQSNLFVEETLFASIKKCLDLIKAEK